MGGTLRPVDSVLIVRMDRLGDVVLSLPSLAYLREALPDVELVFAAQPSSREAVRPFLTAHRIVPADVDAHSVGRALGRQRFDAALVLHAPAPVYRELRRSRVPVRFGDWSRLWTLPFITGGLWQRRSSCEKSEVTYCLELAHAFLRRLSGVHNRPQSAPITIPSDEGDAAQARGILHTLHIAGPFVLVHPGMGGSALNLREGAYVELLRYVQRTCGQPLVLSCGPAPADSVLVAALHKQLAGSVVLPATGLGVLRELLRMAALVIAPSTGPLHLAHYVGTPTVGLFSPVKSHRPERWRPWGGTGPVTILMPRVACPATEDCHGPRCRLFYCMDTRWDALWESAGSSNRLPEPTRTPAVSS